MSTRLCAIDGCAVAARRARRNRARNARSCAAIDADGEWHRGNPPCDCGYDEARAALVPEHD